MVAEQGRLADAGAEAVADVVPDRQRKRSFLVRTALALVSTSFLTSALGFIYWAVSARFFPPSNIGEAATAIAAMNLIAPLTTLGFGTLLLAELPTMSARRTELVSTAAVFSGIFGGVWPSSARWCYPRNSSASPASASDVSATLLFAAGVAVQGVAMMLDSALLSVAGGGPQLWRNATFAVVKLVLLVAFALTLSQHGSLSIYASWFLANVVSVVTMTIWLARKRQVTLRRMWPTRSALHGLHYVAAQHHALNLALLVPYFSMPIVANVTLGSEQAGYLYATWSVAGLVFLLPLALSTALFASGARDIGTFLMELRFTLRYSLAACLAANLVLLPTGRHGAARLRQRVRQQRPHHPRPALPGGFRGDHEGPPRHDRTGHRPRRPRGGVGVGPYRLRARRRIGRGLAQRADRPRRGLAARRGAGDRGVREVGAAGLPGPDRTAGPQVRAHAVEWQPRQRRGRVAAMLVQLSEIRDILACPRCRGPLRDGAAGLQCAQPSCGLADQAFPMVAAQPALIDFDQSILDRAELLANAGSSCADCL